MARGYLTIRTNNVGIGRHCGIGPEMQKKRKQTTYK